MKEINKSIPIDPETDLVRLLFAPGIAPDHCPWNPSDADADSYYQAKEQAFSLDDWSAEDLKQSAHSFFTKLHNCWPDETSDILALLSQKFVDRIPQQWLEKVAISATQAATEKLVAVDQLVGCVQNLLPTWEAEDLLVFARPYSYAMRSDPSTFNVDNLARSIAWEELSDTERVKLTMMVSKYALEHLNQD
jgi:hypothetical protein